MENREVLKSLKKNRRGGVLVRRGQSGTALLEFAIIFPVLAAMIFGVLEFGFVMRDQITLANASRTAARVESVAGSQIKTADYQALLAITGAIDKEVDHVNWVVIFKPNDNGDMVPQCKAFQPVHDQCNVYTGAFINPKSGTLTQDSFGKCQALGDNVNNDQSWFPETRQDVPDSGGLTSTIGVYVQYTHSLITGMYGKSKTLSTKTVMHFEPHVTAGSYC